MSTVESTYASSTDLQHKGRGLNTDAHSVGEESFPILSKYSSHTLTALQSQDNASRSVRFSKNESLTHVFNDSSELPFDEQEDITTTPAVTSSNANAVSPAVSTYAASPPSSSRSLPPANASWSGGLKSILKPARFSPTKSGADPYSTDEGGSSDINTSISKSPPRGGSGFIEAGVELSPISGGNAHGVAFHDAINKSNGCYPDPSLDAPSEYSDPTLDMTGGYNVRT